MSSLLYSSSIALQHSVTTATWERPKVRVRVSRQFRPIGAQEFVLHNAARAEQRLFADGQRIVWVQFEEYLPASKACTTTARDKLAPASEERR